ncbi:MAG: asparagine synthase-related protein [Promethearchaeota archaeon]|jgi:hypothetical protein
MVSSLDLLNFKTKGSSLSLDKIGIIQFILFNYPLYNRTFIEDIKFIITKTNGSQLNFQYSEDREGYFPHNEKRLWNILQNAIIQITQDKQKVYGVGSSGGLDSRVVLYLLNKVKSNIVSYTLGYAPSDAVFIANKVAKRLKIVNHHIPIEPDFLERYWDTVIEKKPMHSLIYSWYLSGAQFLPSFDLHITGFNGDNMLGSHLSKELLLISKKEELFKYIYDHYRMVSDELLRPILREKKLLELAYEDYRQEIVRNKNKRNENIFEEFNFRCRQLRFIRNSINFDYSGKCDWVSPFFTEEFINFALTLTFEERFERRLYYNTVKKHMKIFNNLRFERSAFSLGDQNHLLRRSCKNLLWKIDKKLNLHLYYKGTHKDVKKWLEYSNSIEFIRKKFKKPNEIFSKLFNIDYILDNLDFLINQNLYLVFNLLTIKLWIEKHLGVLTHLNN